MRVAFLGPPGSGKGTYSQMLARKGWVHFSMGQVLREHVAANGKFAKKVNAHLAAGKLVPSSIFFSVFDWFMRQHGEKKIIFDGLPRSLAQAEGMQRILAKRKTPFDAFIYLDVPANELERRLVSRRQCETCGKIYGLTVIPKHKGKCDVEGASLIQRSDDKPAVIRTRFRVYEEQTFPVLEWASARYVVFHIDGRGPPSVVFKRISRAISLIERGKS